MRFTGNGITNCYPDQVEDFISITVLRGPGRADWTAPSADADYTLTVTVTDDDGGVRSANVTITVTGTENLAPTVSVSAPSPVAGGQAVRLVATASDPDGEIESYEWSGTASSSLTFRGATKAQADWTTPNVDDDTDYTFTVTVTDDDEGEASDSVTITVTGTANEAPTVTLAAEKNTVAAGEQITLTATAEDADDNIESYDWRGAGTFNTTRTAGQVEWIAPSPNEEKSYTLRVTVTDSHGETASATVDVTVEAGVAEPTISFVLAGDADSIAEGETVNIEVTISPAAPNGASIRWTLGDANELARTPAQYDDNLTGGDCADYDHVSRTLDLAGRTSLDLPVSIDADTCGDEGWEYVHAIFEDPVGVVLESDTLDIAVANVSSLISLIRDDVDAELGAIPVTEGDSVTVKLKRTISRAGHRVPASVEVDLEPLGGVEVDIDFVHPGPRTVEFGANESQKTLTYRTIADVEHDEDGEGFKVVMQNPQKGARLSERESDNSVNVRILDADGQPEELKVSVRALTPTVTEGGTAKCEVSVKEVAGRPIDSLLAVLLSTVDGSSDAAVDGTDYEAVQDIAVTLEYTAGASEAKAVEEIRTIETQANRENRKFACSIGDDPEDFAYTGSYDVSIEGGGKSDDIVIRNINVGDQQTTSTGPIWAYDQEVSERGQVSFNLNLNGGLPEVEGVKVPLVVNWTTSDTDATATATAGDDYTTASGTHTFRPNTARSFRISVPVRCDNEAEGVEQFHVTATGWRTDNGTQVQLGGESKVKITILPERSCGGGAEIISITDAMAREGRSVQFSVEIPEALESDLLIDYETRDGTARAGSDYRAETGTVTISAGATKTPIPINALPDNVRDEAETFEVRLSNGRTADGLPVGFSNDRATGTIVEKEPIDAEFRGVPTEHGGSAFSMELRLSATLDATTTEVDAAITTENGSHTVDKLSDLVWEIDVTPAGTANVVISLDHEVLNGANSRMVSPVAPVTIYGQSTVSIGPAEANESEDFITFTASLDSPLELDTSVDWATQDGTAIKGRDYEETSGTFTFKAGQTEKRGRVRLFRTTEAEEDETFTVVLSDPDPPERLIVSADAGTGTMTVTDDSLGVEFTQPANPRTDGSNFTVGLTFRGVSDDFSPTTEEVKSKVKIANSGDCGTRVVDVTGSGKNFSVEIDPAGECHVELAIDEGATIGGAVMQYTARIWVMGPGSVSASIEDGSATEGSSSHVRFTVTLNAPPERVVTVDYATSDGSASEPEKNASAGHDYRGASGTLTFDPPQIRQGKPTQVIEVPIIDDIDIEETEGFTISLSNPSAGLVVGDGLAQGRISDNEQVATLLATSTRTGGDDFTVTLTFTEAVDLVLSDLTRTLRLSAGRVADVSKTRSTSYRLTIDPPDERHIEIVLPRGTVLGGKTVRNEARLWVFGPVSIAINDVAATEGAGVVARFAVTLSQATGQRETAVKVAYETEDVDATAGSDYTATSGTLTFGPSDTRKTIDVPILDDDLDDDGETFKVKLSNPTGAGVSISDDEGIGTINNKDALPIALIARFGRATASHVVDQVESRIDAPVRPGIEVRPGAGMLQEDGMQMQQRRPDMRDGPVDPLDGASLAMSRQRGGGTFSVWTRSAQSSFSGQQAHISLGGEVHTRTLGVDYVRGRLLTGLAVAHSRSTGQYSGVSSGEVSASVVGLYPWIGYRATERVTVWAVGGRGGGTMLLARPGVGPVRTGTGMSMLAGGARGRIRRGLAVKSDMLWVGTSVDEVASSAGRLSGATAGITRFRSALEGSRTYTWGRVAIKPSGEVGFRHDGGDAETGVGLDVGAGVEVADATGLGASIQVRRLVMHQAEAFPGARRGVLADLRPHPGDAVGLQSPGNTRLGRGGKRQRQGHVAAREHGAKRRAPAPRRQSPRERNRLRTAGRQAPGGNPADRVAQLRVRPRLPRGLRP